jgi:hypothetical protein
MCQRNTKLFLPGLCATTLVKQYMQLIAQIVDCFALLFQKLCSSIFLTISTEVCHNGNLKALDPVCQDLSPNANLVKHPNFESAIRKLQERQEHLLTAAEADAISHLKLTS